MYAAEHIANALPKRREDLRIKIETRCRGYRLQFQNPSSGHATDASAYCDDQNPLEAVRSMPFVDLKARLAQRTVVSCLRHIVHRGTFRAAAEIRRPLTDKAADRIGISLAK